MSSMKKQFNILKVQDQLQLSSSSSRRLEHNLQLLRNQYINQQRIQKTMDVFNSNLEDKNNHKKTKNSDLHDKSSRYSCIIL